MDLYLQNFSNTIDYEDIQVKIFLYIQKWKDEYNARALRRNFSVGDLVLVAKNYNVRNITRSGALDSFYEEENYIVIEIFANNTLVRRFLIIMKREFIIICWEN